MLVFPGVKEEATALLFYLAVGSCERLREDVSWVTAAGIDPAMRVLSRSRTTRESSLRNAISSSEEEIMQDSEQKLGLDFSVRTHF